ncbi:MAG: two-component regulator propeller domain-containing protein, partial [Chitinophagaceae bacterium]
TGGISKYDGKSFTHFTEKEGLSANNVSDIIEDKSGNLWIGTDRGVSKYDGKTFTYFTENDGLINRNVRSLLEDKSGNLWFATGKGVSKYDGKTFTYYTVKEGLSNNHVGSILEDRTGNLWFGTEEGLTKYDGKTFTHFTEKEGLSGNNVSDIIEDKSGNLWIGTDRGVSKYDGKTFTYFTENDGLSNNNVQSLLEDKSGNFWVGTDFGLNKLTPKSLLKLFANAKISADKGDFADHPNNDPAREVLVKSYSYEDGFLGVGCNPHAILEDKNGIIWIGANDRITAYHPEGDKTDSIPPNMQLTNIALFNENIPWANLEQKKDTSIFLANGVSVGNFKFDSLSRWYNIPEHLNLTYNNNYLSFSFIGITTKSPQKVKYRYKLEGLDNNWSALIAGTEAAYGNLPHGNYTFRVKAMNCEGYWSNEFNYSFTITPPWWGTWWFYALCILTVSASIYILFRYRLSQKIKAFELRETISRDLHDEVGSTLSSIGFLSSMALEDVDTNKEKAHNTLNSINESAHKMLDAMNDIIWDIQPQNDTLDNIVLRMRSFASELLEAKKITLCFNIADNVKHLHLALAVRHDFLLIYKEAVNNLAKYSTASEAKINLEFHHPYLILIIIDNGKGFDPQKIKNGNGLKNMQSRAKKIGAVYHLHTDTGGTTITLQVKPT